MERKINPSLLYNDQNLSQEEKILFIQISELIRM